MSNNGQRGSALLTVLWLSAALTAIAFTIATNVRGETERAATAADEVRSYYLAAGAIERAILYIEWSANGSHRADNSPFYQAPTPVFRYAFPAGEATVELTPETSKLNINTAVPEDLASLLVSLGTPADRAGQIAAAIVDWRSPSPGGAFTAFDNRYLSLNPSFRSRHASFQEIEELLLVEGITPELFYGSYREDSEGRLTPVAGLKECVSVYGATGGFDVNTVQPALMAAIGNPPGAIAGIVATRQAGPIRNMGQLAPYNQGPGFARLGVGSLGTIWTLRATAQVRTPNGPLADLRRSVAATVKFLSPEWNPRYHIMRWYDNAPSAQ